jgi:hypothetical protein
VAQHSLTVLALAEASAEAPLPLVKALRELLHDGTEALMGGIDPISTLRPHLGAKFALLEKRLQASTSSSRFATRPALASVRSVAVSGNRAVKLSMPISINVCA